MSLNIFISAGDQSGDRHAARLMRELKKINSDVKFFGIGGAFMTAEGLTSLVDLKEISVVGFWEVAKKYLLFRDVFRRAKNELKTKNIDAMIAVDYPGFNIPVAKFAREMGIKTFYYIAPQLWAWGANRAKKLAKAIDMAIVVFPFEEDYFKQFGINAKYLGHPILDDSDFQVQIKDFSGRNNEIAFLPGSRKQEIIKNMPLFVETALEARKLSPDVSFVFACAPSIDPETIKSHLNNLPNARISSNAREVMLTARAAMVKTGTSCLEASLLGVPFAMAYKTSAITYFLGKKLINLEHLSLPNILFKKNIVNEFIQQDAVPSAIAKDLIRYATNEDIFNAKQKELLAIRTFLGDHGASERAAETILRTIDNG